MAHLVSDIVDRVQSKLATHPTKNVLFRDELEQIVKYTLDAIAEEFEQSDSELQAITHMKEVWADDDWKKVILNIIEEIKDS